MVPGEIDPRHRPLLEQVVAAAGEDPLGVWEGYTNSWATVLFAVFPTQCRVIWAASAKGQQAWNRDDVRITAEADGPRTVVVVESGRGKPYRLFLPSAVAAPDVTAVLGGGGDDADRGDRTRVGPARLVTLPQLPGHRIDAVHGLVSGVGSLSGWTAASKGRGALERAFPELLAAAERLGANAVVGVQATTFAAGGGITNVVGGDAVGVLLVGTAVTARPEVEESG